MKKCTKCTLEKDLKCFYKTRNQCIECVNTRVAKWKKNNTETMRKYNSNYYINNKEKCLKATRKWQNENAESVKNKRQEYRKINRSREQEYGKIYRQSHVAQINARRMKRKAAKLQATPKWLTKNQLKQIEKFYIECKELQWLSDPTDPLQVDHIIPLQGENVCGLHVPWNLQILPRSLNIEKSNKV